MKKSNENMMHNVAEKKRQLHNAKRPRDVVHLKYKRVDQTGE